MTEEAQPHADQNRAHPLSTEDVINQHMVLLNDVWQRTLPVLGLFTTRIIMQRAIRITARSYPRIGDLFVDEQGINSTYLYAHAHQDEYHDIRAGFEMLLPMLLKLMMELTGEKVVNKLFVNQRQH